MKESLNKIIKISATILLSCIVVYGVVYAQRMCCNTIIDACIPASDRISVSYNTDNFCKISPSHYINNRLQSNSNSNNILTDFSSGNTCCDTDRCDSYYQATYLSLSFKQFFYPVQKNVSSFACGNGEQTAFEPYPQSTSLKTAPIYILTQSIIC
jgi:hypothetical protein